VEFCRPVVSARMLHPLRRPLQGVAAAASDRDVAGQAATPAEAKADADRLLEDASISGEVRCHQDRIELPLTGHGVTHVLVKLRTEAS